MEKVTDQEILKVFADVMEIVKINNVHPIQKLVMYDAIAHILKLISSMSVSARESDNDIREMLDGLKREVGLFKIMTSASQN